MEVRDTNPGTVANPTNTSCLLQWRDDSLAAVHTGSVPGQGYPAGRRGVARLGHLGGEVVLPAAARLDEEQLGLADQVLDVAHLRHQALDVPSLVPVPSVLLSEI